MYTKLATTFLMHSSAGSKKLHTLYPNTPETMYPVLSNPGTSTLETMYPKVKTTCFVKFLMEVHRI